MIKVFIDGACAGNPGKTGIGYVIYKDDAVIKKESIFLSSQQTNNFAEYMALIFALVELGALGEKKCKVFSDSQLLCEQINGNYKVKNNNILPLFILAKKIIAGFTSFTITHINREENTEADKLASNATGFLV
jgi:ribonuclease HI